MLLRKWYWILSVLLLLGLGCFVFLSRRTPSEFVKIYKAVTPDPKPTQSSRSETDIATPHSHDHNGGHTPETTPHSHEEETNISEGEADWRDDDVFESSSPKVDPWKQTYPEQEDATDTDDTYPPRDWYNTTDPALYIEYYQAQLIKQFGDIPEVYILVEFEEKMRAEIPMTLDEQIEQAKALYALWPHQETQATLEMLQDAKASGHPFVHRYQASPETIDPFYDVKPFVEQHGLVEGIRQLSKVNPERAAEVKRVFRERRSQVNPAYIEEVDQLLNENVKEID